LKAFGCVANGLRQYTNLSSSAVLAISPSNALFAAIIETFQLVLFPCHCLYSAETVIYVRYLIRLFSNVKGFCKCTALQFRFIVKQVPKGDMADVWLSLHSRKLHVRAYYSCNYITQELFILLESVSNVMFNRVSGNPKAY